MALFAAATDAWDAGVLAVLEGGLGGLRGLAAADVTVVFATAVMAVDNLEADVGLLAAVAEGVMTVLSLTAAVDVTLASVVVEVGLKGMALLTGTAVWLLL